MTATTQEDSATTVDNLITAPAVILPFCEPDWTASVDLWVAGLDPLLRAHAVRQEAHFIRRVWERFGLRLSATRYRRWIRKVEDVLPGTEFVHMGHEPHRTIWEIRFGADRFHVLYDETTRRLVTCYTPPFGEVLPGKRWQRCRGNIGFVDTDYLAKCRRLMAA